MKKPTLLFMTLFSMTIAPVTRMPMAHADEEWPAWPILVSATTLVVTTRISEQISSRGGDRELAEETLMAAADDAAVYLHSGRMTGILPTWVAASRAQLAREIGHREAHAIPDRKIVEALLVSVEGLL